MPTPKPMIHLANYNCQNLPNYNLALSNRTEVIQGCGIHSE